MALVNVAENDFDKQVMESTIPVLVDFWAAWCGPCRMAEPILEELSDSYSGKIIIAKVNVDENPSLAEKFGVMSIPTTILIKGGKETGRQIGFAGKNAFEELIKKGL